MNNLHRELTPILCTKCAGINHFQSVGLSFGFQAGGSCHPRRCARGVKTLRCVDGAFNDQLLQFAETHEDA